MEGKKTVGLTKTVGFQIGVRRTFEATASTAWELLLSQKGMETWAGHIPTTTPYVGFTAQSKECIRIKITVLKSGSHLRMKWQKPGWPNESILQIRVIELRTK
jgi:hypothetical protein